MTVVLTIGIPASGKTTWARETANNDKNVVVTSRDDIRAAYGWKSGFDEGRVTRIQRSHMEAAFLDGFDVIVADTNLNPKFRKDLIKFCHQRGQDVVTKVFPISLDEAILRDSKRQSHMVGADVIKRFYDMYQQQKPEDEAFPVFEATPYSHGKGKDFREPAVVVDIDGTVARHVNRSPYDESKVLDDEPIEDVVDVVGALSGLYRLVFVSGRTDSCREDTIKWIQREFGLIHGEDFELHMRQTGDQRPDYVIKTELYDEHVIPFYNIKMVFDDREQVVHHVRRRGITVAQVAPGRF
jgi:predicted kinase